ncbi:MAG: riboflavin biosynthesis protein RibF [bacterium]|nr:riboflavin biosynthesis protein RibF [bacterium]
MKECTSLDQCTFDAGGQIVVALGFFDGVHLAHRRIIETCRLHAEARGGSSVVFTFQNHPSTALRPESPAPIITPYPLKMRLIRRLKPTSLLAIPFTREFSRMTPDEFVQRVLVDTLHAREIVAGFNFRYGCDRGGGVDDLRKLVPGVFETVRVIEPMLHEGEPISSSLIRDSIVKGDLDAASRKLGRPFALAGEVIRGDGRGRSIDVPTANLDANAQIAPPNGVYGVRVHLDDFGDEPYWGVMNVGVAPTFKQTGERTVEVHLLDFDGDLYGRYVIAELMVRIREEKKFNSVHELIDEIERDIAGFREWISLNA